MKSRSASEWFNAYDTIQQELMVKDFKPKLQTINTEASVALKNFFTVNDIAYQLVPPHCHRRNAAERAIITFKEHCMAGISLVDPAFPLHLWDRLLPQADITLNLLRTSRLHPQLSAAAHFHGLVDYNKTAFDPPGCKIIAHKNKERDALRLPTGSMVTRWVPLCITTDVKTFTSRPQPVNASWILSRSFPTIIKCHSYHQPIYCSWRPKT
jgi:hypothetical protein